MVSCYKMLWHSSQNTPNRKMLIFVSKKKKKGQFWQTETTQLLWWMLYCFIVKKNVVKFIIIFFLFSSRFCCCRRKFAIFDSRSTIWKLGNNQYSWNRCLQSGFKYRNISVSFESQISIWTTLTKSLKNKIASTLEEVDT